MVWAEFQLWSLRGIMLRQSAMTARRTAPMLRSLLLGSQRRSSPLVRSLVGRCHGERGSQKYTLMLRACSMCA